MLKEAYTAKELSELLGISVKSVLSMADRQQWQAVPRQGRGGGNMFPLATITEGTKAQVMAAVARQVETMPAPVVKSVDVVVPDYAWSRAGARYRVVTEWRQVLAKAKAKGGKMEEATEQFLVAINAGLVLPKDVLAVVGEVTRPTLFRWFKTLKSADGDMEALADRRGGWMRGAKKALGKISTEAEQAFLSAYLKPNKPSMQFAYNATEMHLQKLGLAVPSYSSVRRFYERFDSVHHDVTVWMREGEKAYTDKVGPFMNRNDQILHVGDVLIADGHKLNFLVLNPETGKPCRMTLIGWQDWASRMFVGFDIMLSENTQAISASLFRSIINLGKLPGAVYLDNGAAFKNRFFSGDADLEEMDGLYARLGIMVQHSMPYCARTKVIERWWGDFDRQCEVALPSYTGASIEGKPAHMARNEKWHKEQHAKVAKVPTLEETVRVITEFAMWKALQPHPTRHGETPWSVFMAGRGEGFAVAEAEALSRQFLYRKEIHPRRCRFTLMGIEYEADALHGIHKPLMAHYSFTSLAEVYVYDEGQLLCTALPVASVHPLAAVYGNELDVATVRQAQKHTAKLRSDTRKMASALAAWGQNPENILSASWMLPASERKQPLVLHDNALPYEPRRVEPQKALPMKEAEIQLTEEERAELLAVRDAVDAVRPYDKPAYFASESERYDFLFNLAVAEKTTLTDEDAAFMTQFETGANWPIYAKRYEDLRQMFAEIDEKKRGMAQ